MTTSVNTTASSVTANSTADQNKYFDLSVRGVGYAQRARFVNIKGAEPSLHVRINAIHGSAKDVTYTYFDCKVVGEKAIALITAHMAEINDITINDGKTTHNRKVLVSFSLGDLTVDKWTNNGKSGVTLKARLLKIGSLRIDGVVMYDSAAEQASKLAEVSVQTGTEG